MLLLVWFMFLGADGCRWPLAAVSGSRAPAPLGRRQTVYLHAHAVPHADVHGNEPLGPRKFVRVFPQICERVGVDCHSSHAFVETVFRFSALNQLDDIWISVARSVLKDNVKAYPVRSKTSSSSAY